MLYTLNAKQKNYANFFEILSFGVILHCLAILRATHWIIVFLYFNYNVHVYQYILWLSINRKITWIITDTSVLPWFCKFIISS
jgi:hypothetical protein